MSAEVAAGGLIAKAGYGLIALISSAIFAAFSSIFGWSLKRNYATTDTKLKKAEEDIENLREKCVTKDEFESKFTALSVKMDRMLICVEGIKAEQDQQKGYQQAVRDMQDRGIPNPQ